MQCRRCGMTIGQGEYWVQVYKATDVPFAQAATPHPMAAHLTCPNSE